jgi:hypothetical protein
LAELVDVKDFGEAFDSRSELFAGAGLEFLGGSDEGGRFGGGGELVVSGVDGLVAGIEEGEDEGFLEVETMEAGSECEGLKSGDGPEGAVMGPGQGFCCGQSYS